MAAHELVERAGSQWAGEQEALAHLRTELLQGVGLGRRLDTLGIASAGQVEPPIKRLQLLRVMQYSPLRSIQGIALRGKIQHTPRISISQ